MRKPVEDNLKDTIFDFSRLVWPLVGPWCGGGVFTSVESESHVLAKDLDVLAGIDGFQKLPQKGVMRGIASRIQWTDKDWKTFTIRKNRGSGAETELKKRLYALAHLDKGFFYPHLTIQAYITERRVGTLISVAVTRTTELIPYAYETWMNNEKKNSTAVREKLAKDEDGSLSWFLAVDWDAYKRAGCFIRQWHRTDEKGELSA